MEENLGDLQLYKRIIRLAFEVQKEGTNTHSENRLKIVFRRKNNELHQFNKQVFLMYNKIGSHFSGLSMLHMPIFLFLNIYFEA